MKDPYLDQSSLSSRFRAKRFSHARQVILSILGQKGSCRILDVGGTEKYWGIAPDIVENKNVEIDLLNLNEATASKPNMRAMVGDVCDISWIDSNGYDLCHSNSLIEHVGSWQNMMKAASEIARVAPCYFVQTPYFWFPIEPHYRQPFVHWLPEQIRARMLMKRRRGYVDRKEDLHESMTAVQHLYLLDRMQLSHLFPDARIVSEKLGFITKSLMAIKP